MNRGGIVNLKEIIVELAERERYFNNQMESFTIEQKKVCLFVYLCVCWGRTLNEKLLYLFRTFWSNMLCEKPWKIGPPYWVRYFHKKLYTKKLFFFTIESNLNPPSLMNIELL